MVLPLVAAWKGVEIAANQFCVGIGMGLLEVVVATQLERDINLD